MNIRDVIVGAIGSSLARCDVSWPGHTSSPSRAKLRALHLRLWIIIYKTQEERLKNSCVRICIQLAARCDIQSISSERLVAMPGPRLQTRRGHRRRQPARLPAVPRPTPRAARPPAAAAAAGRGGPGWPDSVERGKRRLARPAETRRGGGGAKGERGELLKRQQGEAAISCSKTAPFFNAHARLVVAGWWSANANEKNNERAA